jgi:hypothetical protein
MAPPATLSRVHGAAYLSSGVAIGCPSRAAPHGVATGSHGTHPRPTFTGYATSRPGRPSYFAEPAQGSPPVHRARDAQGFSTGGRDLTK